jgi:hypothetical protein
MAERIADLLTLSWTKAMLAFKIQFGDRLPN